MPEYQSDPVTQRLDRLERENWYWKRATLLLLIVIGAAILMGQVDKPFRLEAEEIEAESLVLKDKNGKKRVEIGIDLFKNYGLRFYSADGRYLAGLVEHTDTKAVQLELNDNISASSAALIVGNGIASLELNGDEQTKEVWKRNLDEYGRKFNAAKTPQERERVMSNYPSHGVMARINAFPKGTSSVELTYGSSFSRRNAIEMYLSKDGQPTLHLDDEKGISRAVLGYTTLERTATGIVEQRHPSSLVLFDKNGGVIWRAP